MIRTRMQRLLPLGVATALLAGVLAVAAAVDGHGNAAAAGDPTIVACTAAQYQAEMTKLGLDVTTLTTSGSTNEIVASMISDYKCNSFTGGLIPSFGLFNVWTNPGQVVDNGLIDAAIVSSNLTVNQPGKIVMRITGSWVRVDQPYFDVPADYPPAPNGGTYNPHQPSTITMRPGMYTNPGWGYPVPLYAIDLSTGIPNKIATMSQEYDSRGCVRVPDFNTAPYDECTYNVQSWEPNAAVSLGLSGGTATLYAPWIFWGSNSLFGDACNLQLNRTCGVIGGTTQFLLMPVTAAYLPVPKPTAEFTAVEASAHSPQWNFDASPSTASSPATLVGYAWEFGDPDHTTSTEQKASHKYKVDGSYTVSLTVTDSAGQKGSISHAITVKAGIIVNSTADTPNDSAAGTTCDTGQQINGAPECTLRAAIEAANSAGVEQTIAFAIAGDPTITVPAPLPAMTAPVTIDGTTQAGGWVHLAGPVPGTGTGLIANSTVTVKGMAIDGFSAGIGVNSAHVQITGNRIGVDTTGNSATSPPKYAVLVFGESEVTIENNVLTGVAEGIQIGSPSNPGGTATIVGNRIGVTSAAGDSLATVPLTAIVANGKVEVRNNVISASVIGIRMSGVASSGSQVLSNRIGVNADATAFTTMAIGVFADGSAQVSVVDNIVAGERWEGGAEFADVVVAGSRQSVPSPDGVMLTTPVAPLSGPVTGGAATITGNTIGTLPDGTQRHSNLSGVLVYGKADAVLIEDNRIAGHTGTADVWVDDASHVTVTNNHLGVGLVGNTVQGDAQNGVSFGAVTDSMIIGNVIGGASLNGIAVGHSVNASNTTPSSNISISTNNIGLGADGVTIVANRHGATIEGNGMTIGPDNVISGNQIYGLSAFGDDDSLTILGNKIGTNALGTEARPNGDGVRVGSGGATISYNLISGNTGFGLDVNATKYVDVRNNVVGVSSTGTPIRNGSGVLFHTGDGRLLDNRVGNSGSGNGITVDAGARVLLVGNTTSANSGRGIVAPGGPPAPTLQAVLASGSGAKRVWFVISDLPAPIGAIDIFANDGCANGHPQEGQQLLDVVANQISPTQWIYSMKNPRDDIYPGYTMTFSMVETPGKNPVGRTSEYSTCVDAHSYPDSSGTGVPDLIQTALGGDPTNNKTVIFPADGGGVVKLFTIDGRFENVGPSNAPAAPAGVTFPSGQFSFTLSGLIPGDSAAIAAYVAADATSWWRYGPPTPGAHAEWYDWTSKPPLTGGASKHGDFWTLVFTDGGIGDDDGLANGSILDPSAPGIGAAAEPPVTNSTVTTPATTPTVPAPTFDTTVWPVPLTSLTPGSSLAIPFNGQLPATGTDSDGLLGLAAGMSALGVVLLATRRRRWR